MSTRSLSFAAPLTLAAALFSSVAQAQSTCETSADCPKGYDCLVTAATACGDTACPDGQECPPPPPCEPQEFKSCVAVPNACATDADCSPGMVCYTHTFEQCEISPATPCAQGEECPPPPEPECETTTQSSCIPQYMLPCQTATDCGAGFECQPVEECACSGSSGGSTPPSDGAGGAPEEPAPDPVPPEESCTCTPTGTNYCSIIEQTCTADAECAEGWTCSANPESVVCSGPDGEGSGAECGSTGPDMVCLPPYASTVIGVSRDGGPVYAGEDDAGNQTGIPEGSPTSGAPGPDPAPTPMGGGEEADSGDQGGCSIAGGASSSSAAWLSLLGLAALLRRRRQ